MDKTKNFRRGGSSRFSATKRQSGSDGDGDSAVLIKSKKEKLRRLSSVGNEMDSLSHSTSSTKRVKLPKKFFDDDYNPVDRASVPRKLRSAIKKRARESVSPPPFLYPRKLGHTVKNRVEAEAKDCTKKFNSCMQEDSTGSPEQIVIGPITKEEEEVVETLYALAGMFPDHNKANDSIILKEKPSETKVIPVSATKDKDCRLICQVIGGEATDNSTSKFESIPSETTMLPGREQFIKEVAYSVPLVKLPKISAFSKDDSTLEKPSCKPIVKLPPWLVNATLPCSSKNVNLTEKDSSTCAERKKSWKTCTAHVYISRLIRDLKLSELPTQVKPNEEPMQEALPANNGFYEENNSNGVRNAILLHKRLLQDQQQESRTSEICTSNKQDLNHSPLVRRDLRNNRRPLELELIGNSGGHCFTGATQFHYLKSRPQDHAIVPQMLPLNNYCSTSYNDHLSAAARPQVQMQLPPYYGFSGPSNNTTATMLPTKQLWTAADQPRYSPSEIMGFHVDDYRRREDESFAFAPSQAVLSNSSRSKYVPNSFFAPKYAAQIFSPQQQHFIPMASLLAPNTMESHERPLGGGLYFPPNNNAPSSSLQMLCNQHL